MLSLKKNVLTILLTPLLLISLSKNTYSQENIFEYQSRGIQEYIPIIEEKEIDLVKIISEYTQESPLADAICSSKLDSHYIYFCNKGEKSKPVYAKYLFINLNEKSAESFVSININYKKYFKKEDIPTRDILGIISTIIKKEKSKAIPLTNIFSKIPKKNQKELPINTLLHSMPIRRGKTKTPEIEVGVVKKKIVEKIDKKGNVTFTQAILPVRFVYLDGIGNIIKIWSNVKSTDSIYSLKFFRNEIEIEKNKTLLLSYYKIIGATPPYQQGVVYDISAINNTFDIVKTWGTENDINSNQDIQEEILSFI